ATALWARRAIRWLREPASIATAMDASDDGRVCKEMGKTRMKGPARLACALLLFLIAWTAPDAAADAGAGGEGIQAAIDHHELRIDFPAAMQAWDNAGGGLVDLQPALPLECHWASDTRLACRPGDDARFAL